MSAKDDQLRFNKNYEKKFNKNLIKIFESTYEFYNEDINRFCLMLRKGVYPFGCMGDWKKFDETSLPDKDDIHSNLNMEDITE